MWAGIVLSPYFRMHFDNDDYVLEAFPLTDFAPHSSAAGRPLLSMTILLADLFGINLVTHQQQLWPLVIAIYGLALTILFRLAAKEYQRSEPMYWILLAAVPAMILTWGLVDVLSTAAMNLPYALSFLALVGSLKALVDSKRLVAAVTVSVFLLVCSLFYYNALACMFLPLFFLVRSLRTVDGAKEASISRLAWIAAGVLVAAYAIDWLWIHHAHPLTSFGSWSDSRMGEPNLILNVVNILVGMVNVLAGYELFSPFVFPLFVLLSLLMPLSFAELPWKARWSQVKANTVFVAIALCAASAPHVVSGQVSYSIRSVIVFVSFPVMLSVLSLSRYFTQRGVSGRSGMLHAPVMFFLLLTIGYQAFSFSQILRFSSDLIAVNASDRKVAEDFVAGIRNYEDESGTRIDQVYFVDDTTPERCYKDSEPMCALLYSKAFSVPWSQVFPLNKVSGREWKLTPRNDPKYRTVFDGKNWDKADVPAQLKFDGNVAVIAVF
jgi:hypothetical protein